MRYLFDFLCSECGTKFEELSDPAERVTACKKCGYPAHRLISAPHIKLDPVSGDFPGATLKWEKEHERAGAKGRHILDD